MPLSKANVYEVYEVNKKKEHRHCGAADSVDV
jgi:hypothetical protein